MIFSQQNQRANVACESMHDMNESYHRLENTHNLHHQGHHEHHPSGGSDRFEFDYSTNSPEEDELLDVIAKWQEA